MRRELNLYVSWYNGFRPHQGLDGRVPMDVYRGILVSHEDREACLLEMMIGGECL